MDKILKLQSEIGVLSKTETNPFFKSKYMDINGLLAQLQPLLEKYGLTVIQPIKTISERNAIWTEVWDGESRITTSDMMLPDIQDPQKMGSAITYYRRYALQSLFLLQAQDDDGEGAKNINPKVGRKEYREKTKTDYENNVDPLKDDINLD